VLVFDFVGIGILILLFVLFAWATRRSWNARRPLLRWLGVVPSALLSLLALALTGAALYGFYQLNRTHSNPVADVNVAATPDLIARGEKFARTCAGCHAANGQLPLSGMNFGEEIPLPIGTLYAPNLTPAHLANWSDGEIIRAIREGVHKDGRSLIIMPSGAFRSLSDEDAQALVAFLRSQPVVEPDTPPNRLNVIGAIMATALGGLTAQPPLEGTVAAPAAGINPEYGQYLATVGGCRECHGENFQSQENGPPPLVGLHNRWSEQQFVDTIRTGTTPEGRTLDPNEMPWKDYEKYSDEDLKAIYSFIQTQ
jgi:cytochrome c553